MKRIIALLLSAVLLLLPLALLSSCQDPNAGNQEEQEEPSNDPSNEPSNDPSNDPSNEPEEKPSDEPSAPGGLPALPPGGENSGEDPGLGEIFAHDPTNYVVLEIEGYGDILVELYPDAAPLSVANFQKLVQNKAFDETIIHRVVHNFVIQGGGFTVGSNVAVDEPKDADTIFGEFSSNGYENPVKHKRGVLSMARAYDKNSASNQFFICLTDEQVAHLDGQYAAFGMVIEGMDVVDEIAGVRTDMYDQPYADVVVVRAYFVDGVQE